MKLKYIFYATLFSLSFNFTLTAAPELIWASVLIRHGDRTPITKLKNCAYDWKPGLGELTPKGMMQEFSLGRKLRKRYVDKFKILSPNFNINEPLAKRGFLNC